MHKLLIIFIVLLVGCQSSHTPLSDKKSSHQGYSKEEIYNRYTLKNQRYFLDHDGAPVTAQMVSFKEPTPTNEPLSRYGNPTQYHVDGRSYHVMKSSSGYKTQGIASWYGTKFHKQRTSSGEPYNMYVMSAAHKTLPLPSYVRVKNLENGKVAVVRVNDRGPFHANRIIDLSYAAAVKLGVFPKGTARVEIETLKGPKGSASYYLQAGAFSSEDSAKRLKSKLHRITPSPVFIEHYRHHYIVRVGPFGNKIMTDNLKSKLTRNGVKGSFSVLI